MLRKFLPQEKPGETSPKKREGQEKESILRKKLLTLIFTLLPERGLIASPHSKNIKAPYREEGPRDIYEIPTVPYLKNDSLRVDSELIPFLEEWRDLTEAEDPILIIEQQLFNCLEGKDATALGFSGFRGKVTADIGSRDGRYIPLLKRLGSKEIFAIEPNKESVDLITQANVLDQAHIIPHKLQDAVSEYRGKFQALAVFNFMMNLSDSDSFLQAAYDTLSDDGEIVITAAEFETFEFLLPKMEKYFLTQHRNTFPEKKYCYPNKYILIGREKPLVSRD